MKFHGGKKRAIEWTAAESSSVRRSARYARVLAEMEVAQEHDLCRRKKLIYVVDELGILLELTVVEYYDPGLQSIRKARTVQVPPETRWLYVSGATCPTHGEYEIQAWLPNCDIICGCCALEKVLRFESLL